MENKKLKITALLTARGNNTLKDKNITNMISGFYVNSDDDKILNIASKLGYIAIKRPDELSKPTSLHIDTIKHSIKIMKEQYSDCPDILVVLMGNCATIKTKWINDCIELILNDKSLSAVVPVSEEMDYHPYRAKKINAQGLLEPFFDFKDEKISTNRQDLVPNYFLCHNFWILNIKQSIFCKNGQKPWDFMGNRIKPYIVEKSFDVHNEDDIIKSENWIISNKPDFMQNTLTKDYISNSLKRGGVRCNLINLNLNNKNIMRAA